MITKIQFTGGEGNGSMLANVTFENGQFGPVDLFNAAEAWVKFYRSQIITDGTYKLDFVVTSDKLETYSGTMYIKQGGERTLRGHMFESLQDMVQCPEYLDPKIWVTGFQRRLQNDPEIVTNVYNWISEISVTI